MFYFSKQNSKHKRFCSCLSIFSLIWTNILCINHYLMVWNRFQVDPCILGAVLLLLPLWFVFYCFAFTSSCLSFFFFVFFFFSSSSCFILFLYSCCLAVWFLKQLRGTALHHQKQQKCRWVRMEASVQMALFDSKGK